MRAGSMVACSVATLVLLATGCQSQPGAPMAPMLSADRVPPPATRVAAPAAVQPYAPMPTQQYLPGASLQPTPQPSLQPAEAIATVRSTEPAIGLPQDDRPVRLTAISPPAAPATVAPTATPQVASLQTQAPVTPAPEFTPSAEPSLVWNSNSAPQVPSAAVAPVGYYAAPGYAPAVQAQQATYVYQPTPTPRVRLPSYPSQAPTAGQVQVTELPPAGYVANSATPYVAADQTVYGMDGFQPRGTVVRRPPTPVAPEIQ